MYFVSIHKLLYLNICVRKFLFLKNFSLQAIVAILSQRRLTPCSVTEEVR